MKIKIELDLDTDKPNDIDLVEDVIEQLYTIRNILEKPQERKPKPQVRKKQ